MAVADAHIKDKEEGEKDKSWDLSYCRMLGGGLEGGFVESKDDVPFRWTVNDKCKASPAHKAVVRRGGDEDELENGGRHSFKYITERGSDEWRLWFAAAGVKPARYFVDVENCDGFRESLEVRVYPGDANSVSVTFSETEGSMASCLGAARKLADKFQKDLVTFAFNGGYQVTGGWVEDETSWRARFGLLVNLSGGFSLDVTLMASLAELGGIPPAVSDFIADARLSAVPGVSFTIKGNPRYLYDPLGDGWHMDWGQLKGELRGKITLTLEAFVGKKGSAGMSVSGQIEPALSLDVYGPPKKKPAKDMKDELPWTWNIEEAKLVITATIDAVFIHVSHELGSWTAWEAQGGDERYFPLH
jgi:hypothetical protein